MHFKVTSDKANCQFYYLKIIYLQYFHFSFRYYQKSATMSQRLMIKWEQHVFNMMSELPKFLNNKQYTDVTLSCNGTNIEAHKVILALASEYFRTSLLTNSCPHPFYVFKDLHYLDVKAVLDFVYTGKVSISENRLAEFKKVVDTLQIKGFYDASIERSHPDDHPKVNKYKKRRNRGHRGAATHSKASLSTEMLPDLDVVHEIYRKNPSSPAENVTINFTVFSANFTPDDHLCLIVHIFNSRSKGHLLQHHKVHPISNLSLYQVKVH